MSEIKNVVQIKRGPGQPADGVLFSYELGFDTSEGYLYIGNEAEQAVAQKIKAGYADAAGKLSTARTIQIDLASSSAIEFDGSKNIITGVTGVLPVGNGGTGLSTITSGSYLVGNDTSISLKTPAEVLADIGALGKNGDQLVENGGIYTMGEWSYIGNIVPIDSIEHAAIIGIITDPDKGASFGYYTNYELKNLLFLGDGYSYLNSQLFLEYPLAIECGGTGANNASAALANLGALGNSGNQTITNGSLTLDGNGHSVIVQRTIDSNLHKAYLFADANKGASVAYYLGGSAVNKMFLGSSNTTFTKPVAVGSGGTGATTAASAITNLGLDNRVFIESQKRQVNGNQSYTFTFNGIVKCVMVAIQRTSGGVIMSAFWDTQTSGLTDSLHGELGSSATTWATTVTINGKNVTVKREGETAVNYYVTAFCTP